MYLDAEHRKCEGKQGDFCDIISRGSAQETRRQLQETWDYIQNNADTIIALGALLVSVSSILIGYFALKSQQKHNRLSVKPIGKIHFITVEDRIEIEIRNDGTGPMLCSNIKVYENEFSIKDNLRDAIPILQEKNDWVQISTSSQFAIGAGDQKTLLKISADYVSPEFHDYCAQVLAALNKITLELEYRDIYDQHIGTLRREKWKTVRGGVVTTPKTTGAK